MKNVRLLPVVIFAAAALLLFKGIGIIAGDGYVLTGMGQALAAGAAPAGDHGGGAPAGEEVAEGGGGTPQLPEEPTLEDTSPQLEDAAPTVSTAPAGEAAADDHGAAAPGAGDHGEAPAAGDHGAPAPGDHGEAAAEAPAEPPADPRAEGIPSVQVGTNQVPLTAEDGVPASESVLLQRLADRRAELDTRAAELDARLALVEAAEKRLDERKAELTALEASIKAMVEEKKAMEEGQFKSLVSMYETMKPADASPIFNQLEMPVLLRLARSMNPRKLAPILAKMNPDRAEQLTIAMASSADTPVTPEPTIPAEQNLANLPQIVGQ